VVESREDFGDGGRVGNHATSSHDLSQVTTRNDSWWLVVDAYLEAGGTPIDELDGPLGLDGGDGSVDILGDDITSVHQAAGHVFTVSWVALNHHIGWLESRVGDFGDGELFVVGFFCGNDGSIR